MASPVFKPNPDIPGWIADQNILIENSVVAPHLSYKADIQQCKAIKHGFTNALKQAKHPGTVVGVTFPLSSAILKLPGEEDSKCAVVTFSSKEGETI